MLGKDNNSAAALNGPQSYLASVQSWMLTDKLELIPDKTEFLLIGNEWLLGVGTLPAKPACNVGVIFDKTFNFHPHISENM